jgi:DNA-binding transcriptional ArsR family regulator
MNGSREHGHLVAVIQALADPLRLALLQALMAGPATVSELVALSGASQSNVSNHLSLLRARGLVRAVRQGRHNVYELRDATVAQLVESLSIVAGGDLGSPDGVGAQAASGVPRPSTAGNASLGIATTRGRATQALAAARTCYDHFAGRLGVALFDALVARGAIIAPEEPAQMVTLGPQADAVFGAIGVEVGAVRRARRRFATGCLDWTERRPHLGGALGAAVWERCRERGWVAREPDGRAVVVTDAGRRGFHEWLGIEADARGGWRTGVV